MARPINAAVETFGETRSAIIRAIVFMAAVMPIFTLSAATTIHVPVGGDLQQAINQAAPGDTITLAPGKVYTGNFVLPKKTGGEFITITTSDQSSLPPPSSRITPQAASMLPKIVSPDWEPAIATGAGAHHYRLVGLEIRSASSIYSLGLVLLGSASATDATSSASDLELDRLYIHGDPEVGAKRGVALNSRSTTIRNCHISDIKSTSQDTQAIAGWNGAGPFGIFNNYLEAGGQSIIFGGAVANTPGLIPSDIVIRYNHFKKPLTWKQGDPQYAGTPWLVRSLLQLTNARRVLVEGNIFENSWAGSEMGYAVVFKVLAHNGNLPWAVIEDVTFVRNLVRHAGGVFQIVGKDDSLGAARRILLKDNLFYDINPVQWGGEGRILQLQETVDVSIDHNTVIHNGSSALFFGGQPSTGFVFRNNITPHGTDGVSGDGTSTGISTLNQYAPSSVFLKNALAGGNAGLYPSGSFFPASLSAVGFVDSSKQDYRLAGSSPYKAAGTDGKDLGADINAIMNATKGVDDPSISRNSPPTADSTSPSSGSGLTQTFALAYSDIDGHDDIEAVNVLFNQTFSYSNGCYVQYDRTTNSLWLRNDAGVAWFGPAVVGSGGGLSNSQCTLHVGSSSVEAAGDTLTLEAALTFSSSFSGPKTIFMNAWDEDGLSSEWQARGTWTPWTTPQNYPPQAVSVTPSSGKGASQVFKLLYSDPDGSANITSAETLVNGGLAQANGCYVRYVAAAKSLWLRNDSDTAWTGPAVLGSTSTLTNSSCTVNAKNSAAVAAGTTLALDLALAFTPAFTGIKNIYLFAVDANSANTGWQQRGTWNPAPKIADGPIDLSFEHHFIDPAVPGAAWGQLAVADLDKDGKPDVIIGQRASGTTSASLYWYKNTGKADKWSNKMLLGTDAVSDCGMYPADIDGDGWTDIVSSGIWYRNPRKSHARSGI